MGGEGGSGSVSRLHLLLFSIVSSRPIFSGLNRSKETLLTQLRDLNQSKPRGAADENLITEISRLESAIATTKDELVSPDTQFGLCTNGC